jgi:PadR family transcriptional regulator
MAPLSAAKHTIIVDFTSIAQSDSGRGPRERDSRFIPVRNSLTGFRYLVYIAVIMTDHQLGEFEQIVVLAILRLGEEAYGASIRSEIEKCTGRGPTAGALYTTLDRLEFKSMLTSRMGEPTAQRGGRAKRYFKVTKTGTVAVTRAQRAYQRLLKGLELIGGAHA